MRLLISDQTLVERLAAGDQAALETLIYRYHAPLRGYLERMLHDKQKAEDFTQETFMRLIHAVKKQQPPSHVRAWMYQVATNLCRDHWRSAAHRTETLSRHHVPERVSTRPSVLEIFEKQELRKEVLSALAELSEVQRQIVVLRFYQEFKLQEIADTLKMPLGTVKSSLFHALRRLKKQLNENGAVTTPGNKAKEGHR